MAGAYSEDLRERALGLMARGKKAKEVAELLNISRSVIFLWRKQKQKTGSVAAKSNWQKGHSHKVPKLDVFRKFAEENSGLNSIEMAEKWGNITPKTIRKWLARIGYTQKKRVIFTKNATKKSVKRIYMK